MILFTIVLATFPISIVKTTDNKFKEEYGDHQNKTSAWKSGSNYTIIDNYPYSWIEINETGTNITNNFIAGGGLDDGVTGISFSGQGWNFTFYGTEYDTINVTTNGLLSFSGQGNFGLTTTFPIPQNGTEIGRYNDSAFLFLTDLNLNPLSMEGAGSVFYEFNGNAPNRYLVIEYFQVNNYSTDGLPHLVGDFEAIFYENGDIKFQYKLVRDLIWDDTYASPVVGLDHGDLINYSNYTNNWTKTFDSSDVKELAVYFRLTKGAAIYLGLPTPDDDNNDGGEVAIPGFDSIGLFFSMVFAIILLVRKIRKKKNY